MASTIATTIAMRDGGDHDNQAGVQMREDREERERGAARQKEKLSGSPVARTLCAAVDVVNWTSVQTIMYLIFVVIFQSLTNTLRVPEEFYFDKVWPAATCPCGSFCFRWS